MDKTLDQMIEEVVILLKRNDKKFVERVLTYAILLEKARLKIR